MEMAVEIRDVSFAYKGAQKQLKNVSLSVKKGEVVVLTGPSGGGKSTLTRVVNGLVPYFYEGELSGEVRLLEKNLAELPSWERGRYVGNVFQDPRSQFFANEVAGEIAFGCENYGFSHDDIVGQVERVAAELQIGDLLEEKVRHLSYGMRQRVAIASAKAIDPPVYVMDEPSANLDMEAAEGLAEAIRRLKAQGKAILVAEHRLYYLRNIADRIVYLRNGEIAAEFSPAEAERLSTEQIVKWGLRSVNLEALSAQKRQPPPPSDAVLEVRGLCKSFGSRVVAEEVGFRCGEGEVVAIVGPNAAGKSTLGKMLSGLVEEDSGMVFYQGKRLKPSDRRGFVWYIMQDLDSQLFGEDLTDELLAGHKVTPERKRRAEEILRDLDLAPLAERHPATLSGGQKQRLALGVALMNEAPVLILDEPTSGLDGKSMRRVSEQIARLASKGHVVLMVTHDVECALSTCNRALRMENGRLASDFAIESAQQLLRAMR